MESNTQDQVKAAFQMLGDVMHEAGKISPECGVLGNQASFRLKEASMWLSETVEAAKRSTKNKIVKA